MPRLAAASPAFGQAAQQAELRITVIDQTGASIPMARVRVTPANGTPIDAVVNDRGQTTLTALPAGNVQLHVESDGFTPVDRAITLRRGSTNQTITLGIAGVQEEIVVSDAAAEDTRGNSLTTTLEEDEIAELSDDPDELRAQLEAMTGGAGAVFQVNGFRGGRLPNRDEIRQIRFRTNSFSADNHDAGRVQVEIITRPGLTEWSGNANFGLRNDVLNARNAFARTQTPEQFRRFTFGLRGPLVRSRTSLRFNVDGNRSFDSGTIVALLPDGRFGDQVKRPFEQTNVTAALEHGFTTNQTFRFEYRRSEDARQQSRRRRLQPDGARLRPIVERATRCAPRCRASSDDRRSTSSASSSTTRTACPNPMSDAPAVIVIDAFSVGGAGVSSEGSTRTLEVADNFDFNVGKHAMRAGLLLESGAFINRDARNSAGTFTFSSLEAFLAGTPNTFTQRLGQLRTAFSQNQLGVYWQDDYRLNRSLAISVGVREELQSHVGDAMNVMPRLGFTYTPRRARTTIRGGYGIFHDWYESNLYDQTLRVTGEAGGAARPAHPQSRLSEPGWRRGGDDPRRRARAGGSGPEDAVRAPGVDRHRTAPDADGQLPGVVHDDARPQPAALAQCERAGRVRRATRAERGHCDADRIDRTFGDRPVQRELQLPRARTAHVHERRLHLGEREEPRRQPAVAAGQQP